MRRDRYKMMAFVLTLLMAAVPVFSIPAPPSGHDADWNEGWTACYVADHPPAVVPVPAPVIVVAQVIALDPLIAAAHGPLTLAPAHYKLSAIANLKYSVDGSGSIVDLPTNSTDFKAVAANVTVSNFIALKAGLFFEAAADKCGVTGCQLGVGQPAGSVEQAFKTLPGGTNANFASNKVGVTTTVSVYIDESGATVSTNNLAGSTNEYALRFEVGGADGKTMQSGATVANNTIVNNNGCKDAIGVRLFQDVNFSDNTVMGDIRWGQDPGAGAPATTAVGQYASGSMTNNHFSSNGMAIPLCEVYQGVKLSLTGNTFTNPLAPPVSADAFSQVTTKGNTSQIYAGSKAWEFWAASSHGAHVAQGGDVTVTVPVPAN